LAEYAARPLQIGLAWREMVHRYAAGTLGVLIVCLTAMGLVWRRQRLLPTAYVAGLLGIVIAQGLLGMLTVTWQLKPSIVTMHLLFGLTTLSLLWWLVLTLWRQRSLWPAMTPRGIAGLAMARRLAVVGLVVLACQIALGGWTSSNYAALACPDVPTCQGAWWPHADFRAGFVLWHPLSNIDYQGGVLASPARIAIQLTHRMGAVLTTLVLVSAALVAMRPGMRWPVRLGGAWVLAMLALQLTIGISMVLRGFPLWLATAHNAGAALLLLAVLALNRAAHPGRLASDSPRLA
jgi:cytochrome c oxidase assembly protein subunit 15